jgi:hypothetical protein
MPARADASNRRSVPSMSTLDGVAKKSANRTPPRRAMGESGRVHDAINAFQRLAEAFTRGEVALHPLHIGFGSWPARQEAHGSALHHQTHDEVAAQVAGRACNQDDALAADHVRSHVLEKRHCVDQIGGREALRESDAHRCQKVVPLPSAVPAWPSPKAFRSAAM